MTLPQGLQNFDIANATVEVWLFKKSTTPTGDIRFTGRWINTDVHLDAALKQAAIQRRENITEVNAFSLLSNTNDGVALQIDALETHADAVVAETANPVQARKVKSLKEIQNTKFYVIKFVNGDHVLHGVRKTDDSWQSKKVHTRLSVFFSDDQLGLNQNPESRVQHLARCGLLHY